MRVVLVDDNAEIRGLVREALADQGCTVVGEAGDGEEAIAVVDRLRPALVVMDYRMPGVDGLTATAEIRRRHPDVEIVAFTSTGEPGVIEALLDAGASRQFDKWQVRELLDYIAQRAEDRASRISRLSPARP